ncbi:MAG: UvrD-helicase domain-containing protein [Pseudomonadota bacterium]
MPPANPLLPALDPARSVVVEACAGSGKTWLLVSRMLRLLLAGARPSELLAITFTRKAAEEMRTRLDEWLRDLALLPEAQALDFLVQRGLSETEAHAALPRARSLLEAVLLDRPGPLITTFHGWFFHLLDHAPLSQRLGGELVEHPALLREEAWFDFTESLGERRGAPEEAAFAELAGHFSLSSLRALLDGLLERRAEWWAYHGDTPEPVQYACDELERRLGIGEQASPLADFFALPGLRERCLDYGASLGLEAAKLKTEAKRAAHFEAALSAWDTQPEAAFEALRACLLTEAGTPRALKVTGAMQDPKRLGPARADAYVSTHYQLAEAVAETLGRLAEQRALRLNRLGLVAGLAYLETYQRLKSEQGGLDFTDAELEVARLLDDDACAAAVLMKLDARWKHLLLDEFQDTNPLQWRILRAWLEAYGADGERPTVFLVGDPKQSIYRFRRAEPRLFRAAGEWLTTRYGAHWLPQNETRRCAPGVVAWVNAVFAGRPDYPAFAPHTAHQQALPAWCELAALAPADAEAPAPIAFRPPLTTPPPSTPPRRAAEAAWVARRIQEIVGRLEIAGSPPRPARYGDITVLYAKRAEIDVFEAAFLEAGVPFVTDRRGELLNTLEARDLTALLTCLVDPRDDLALAHALRSPLFGLSNPDLQHLANATENSWWERLMTWAAHADAPASVSRAAALLAAWRTLAGSIPVHDLLDQIYHQADVSTHYASAVPERMQATVLANLEALLGLSLTLSGGRYPSLPRFLDELRRLRDKAGQDGPDEAPAAGGERVRMLTVHSAKGLESPVVFLIKTDAGAGRDDPYGVLMDWPPESDRPTHFSLHGPLEWRGPGRDVLIEQERRQAEVERLNLLYVAMTRARQALLVSGVREGETAVGWLGELEVALERARTEIEALPRMAWLPQDTVPEKAAAAAETPPPLPEGIGTRRAAERAEATFGIRLHAWLEHRTQGRGEAETRALLGLDAATAEAVAAQAGRILAIPELAPAFDPARHLRAHNELEFLDAEGRSARMDRLVEFADEVWVLDYKSGGLDEPDLKLRALPHLAQIEGYRRAAAALYPGKPVRAALVFADARVAWL